jgi:hypothetical protein
MLEVAAVKFQAELVESGDRVVVETAEILVVALRQVRKTLAVAVEVEVTEVRGFLAVQA